MTSISPTSPFHNPLETRALPPLHGAPRAPRRRRRPHEPHAARDRAPATSASSRPRARPSRRRSSTPSTTPSFKVKGARNLHMSASILGLLLYAQFSEACRASPAAREAVHRCVGIVLTLGTGIGLSGAFVIWEYVKSVKTESSKKEIEVGRAKAKAHFITSLPILALGLTYLFY